ncbi:MAG: AraC family transcriptional regulator [Chitinophagaceae bacterium]
MEYEIITPNPAIADYIKFFWHLSNKSGSEKKVIILPDGYFDIIFYTFDNKKFRTILVGLYTEPSSYNIPANAVSFAISFKLLAAEYLLRKKLSYLLNRQASLPNTFWNLQLSSTTDFAGFANAVTAVVTGLIKETIDQRKQTLSGMVYNSNGSVTIKDLAGAVHWSSRQINRYFKGWFGITLKSYCNILRYRASFKNLKEGKLFPEEHFSDQAHFIKQIKKYSGVTPKELARNENDRFIQFSTLPDE